MNSTINPFNNQPMLYAANKPFCQLYLYMLNALQGHGMTFLCKYLYKHRLWSMHYFHIPHALIVYHNNWQLHHGIKQIYYTGTYFNKQWRLRIYEEANWQWIETQIRNNQSTLNKKYTIIVSGGKAQDIYTCTNCIHRWKNWWAQNLNGGGFEEPEKKQATCALFPLVALVTKLMSLQCNHHV